MRWRTLDFTVWITFRPPFWGALPICATPLLPPTSAGFLLAAFCTGWGGLSVLCQTAAVLDGTDLSLRTALLGKLLQGAFSALLASAIALLF